MTHIAALWLSLTTSSTPDCTCLNVRLHHVMYDISYVVYVVPPKDLS
jgi:hypothetical protein